ncbi:MAG TPA: isoprenylcysteine carboxylmethyltransferase family protein [Gaiellaceae bacterium]|nr:isoprenylcysteine carboxylmethyltransferase family protein [Gaiellaceae bacterium]
MSTLNYAVRSPAVSRVASSAPLAILWLLFAAANFADWSETHRPVGLGATVCELVLAVLFVIRRPAESTDRTFVARGATAIGTFGILLARPNYGPALGLGKVWFAMQLIGASIAIASAVALGRSFGLVAANRGICTRGPYRFVRHPLYAGYLIAWTGYVLENPSAWNLALFAVVTSFQAVRIVTEERCLDSDPAYRDYRERVPRRVVPFVL